jgi:N-acetyl-alpha-D-glucosaminyl L-malate synthase BshA
MKIGIVCYPTYGGSGVVATELGKALAAKNHQVHFITYSQPFRLSYFTDNIFYHEVAVSDYPLFEYQPYESALASKIVDVVKYENLDLLHVHYAIPHASAALMAKNILASQHIHIPFITTLHGTDITLVGRDPSFLPVIKYSLENSDAITSVSESLREDTETIFALQKPISVIPNFINLEEYKITGDRCQRWRYAPGNEKILIHVSNFRKVKRVDDVLRVFDKVRKKIPCKLILVGDGPERGSIEKLCRELNTCGDIISLGKIADPKEVLSISDLFLLTSETESFGLAALEAMAMKVPVISTNTGGLPEVNVQGATGYLCDVGDTDTMAKHAVEILSDESKLARFKEAAYKRATDFDIKKVLIEYEELYDSVLSSYKVVK